MCGSKKTPKVVQSDPLADQRKAEATAATEANMELAARRKRRSQSSLLTVGAAGLANTGSGASLLAQAAGQSTLGGG